MRQLLGRDPSQAEVAAAITLTESNPISGRQDAKDILGAVYNRARFEGGIDQRAYDGIAYKKRHGVGAGHLGNITVEKMKPYVDLYKSWESGEAKPSHPYTHYFHPTAMKAIGERRPGMVRSSPWRTIVFGDNKITAPMPTWANPKAAKWSGGHTGYFTTPSHIANNPRYLTSAEAQYPAPPIQTLEFDPARDSGYVQRSLPTERLQTTEDLIKLLKDGALPPLPTQAPGEGTVLEDIVIDGDDTGDAYGDVLQEVKKTPRSPYAPTPDVSSAGDTAKAPLTTASTLPPGGYGEFMPQPRGGNANEDLSPPPVVDSSGAPPPLPTTPGATPPRLRPDQTSDWVQWQHGQMQGALNTGPTQYVPPTQPKPVSQYNMNLANLLGGLFR